MTNIQENKLNLIKSRFKQMCLKTCLKEPIDLQSVIDPGRAFHSLRAAILNAQSSNPLSLLQGAANGTEDCGAQCSNTSSLLEHISHILEPDYVRDIYTRSNTLKSILFSTGSQCNVNP